MASALDFAIIQNFTGGVNMPSAQQAENGYVARGFVDGNGRVNLEYVSPADAFEQAADVTAYGAVSDGSANATTAINAALASGRDKVYFPPGTYLVTGTVTGSADQQTVEFAPGAMISLGTTGRLVFSGDQMQVLNLHVILAAATSSTFDAVTLSGASSVMYDTLIEATAAVENATLLRVKGNRTVLRQVVLRANNNSFGYGVVLQQDADEQVRSATIEGLDVELRGDGGDSADYKALLYLRTRNVTVTDFIYEGSSTDVISEGVVVVDGQRTVFNNIKITQAFNAAYGVYQKRAAEFTSFFGGSLVGRTNGTYLTDSEAIHCEHGAGHLKLHDLNINGWDYGIGIYGTHDTPIIQGGVIAQLQTAAIVIDSAIVSGPDTGVWPVSGMSLQGMYFEYGAPGAGGRVIWCKTGSIEGLHISGCLWGYETHAIYVEDGFEELSGGWVDGCRLIGTLNTDAVIRPNATTDIQFGRNQYNVTSLISNGTHELKACQVPRTYRSVATANFANFLTAGASHELAFSVANAAVDDAVNVTLAANVATLAGFQCTAWVHTAGQVRIRGYNASALNHTSVSGSCQIELIKRP